MAVLTIRPTGAGDVTNLTPSAGNNWENVDEAVADEGATYNHGNDYDLYALTNHGAEADPISNVRVHFRFQSSTGANGVGYSKIKIGGNEYNGGNENTIAWASFFTDYAQNPQSVAAWTWTDIDNLQAGAHVSVSGAPVGELTQVYVEVTHAPAVAGWSGGDLNGVAEATLGKINGVDIANIGKLCGV